MNKTHLRGARALAACFTCFVLIWVVAGCRSAEQAASSPQAGPATRPADAAADAREPGDAPASSAATQPAGGWVAPPGRAVLRVSATGFQIYTAETGSDGQMKWTFVRPAAELRDGSGRVIGRHYKGDAGPVWESNDGSRIVGKKRLGAERKSPHPDSVPELQLDAKPAGGRAGVLSKVTFVERLDTSGGVPPTATASTAIGEEARSPYTAEYVFYAP